MTVERLLDALLDRIIAVEFFFLLLRQSMYEEHAVGKSHLDLPTMRTGVSSRGRMVVRRKVELIHLKRPATIEISAAFEFHREQHFDMELIDDTTSCLLIILSEPQGFYKERAAPLTYVLLNIKLHDRVF